MACLVTLGLRPAELFRKRACSAHVSAYLMRPSADTHLRACYRRVDAVFHRLRVRPRAHARLLRRTRNGGPSRRSSSPVPSGRIETQHDRATAAWSRYAAAFCPQPAYGPRRLPTRPAAARLLDYERSPPCCPEREELSAKTRRRRLYVWGSACSSEPVDRRAGMAYTRSPALLGALDTSNRYVEQTVACAGRVGTKCRIETQHDRSNAAWSRYVPKPRDCSTDGC